ncbi:hypothetical protein PISMIDRAFT_675311 [Pisolithus microcarpus 441]|uniref:Uncharacterized protein n=1 Tax=Pisolithus microcarpus 441 TaxID=765257 RepID=A0A0C9ZXV3_9AGAM|nr:hypothetical protein BKA83DRAFT_675311 [Pisolithus microcarpus]KIK26997.1 hypothetical protein PISMIDRAFT_675311 [Pisolithus microcarpus 441]
MTSTSSSASSDLSVSPSTTPPPPSSRRRPTYLRSQNVGIDPSVLAGKVLTRIGRSPKHPSMQLHFADGTAYQILVDGYDPVHRGLPKALEMDPTLDSLLGAADGPVVLERTIDQCALVTLTDKAFESRQREQRWDQNHVGVAFKFSEEQVWHCVWAMLTDHENGMCVFRSYNDVYLDQLRHSPRKRHSRTPSSPA